MKLTLKTKVQKTKNVIYKTINNETFILDTKNSTIHTLNQTAGLVWTMVQKPITIEKIIQNVSQRYDVGSKQVKKDVLEFVDKSIKNGYIKTSTTRPKK